MKNSEITEAINYHESTKHSYVSVRTSGHVLDWANKPHPFKVYEDLPRMSLPRDISLPTKPVFESFTQQPSSEKSLDLKTLASILYFTGGITRVVKYGMETVYFRAAPATGALYPIELYVVAGDVDGLEPGVYHFDPKAFCLTVLRRGDFRGFLSKHSNSAVAECSAAIVFTSMAWRNAWKYRERSYRHWFWDSGVMAANMLLTCNSFDLRCRLLTGFVDDEVNMLLGVDGVREAAVLVAAVGHSDKHPDETRPDVIEPKTRPLSRHEKRFPLIERMHMASCLYSVEELRSWLAAAAEPTTLPKPREHGQALNPSAEDGAPLWEVILRRGSTRKFSRTPITYDAFSTIVRKTFADVPTDYLGPVVSLFVIVNDVEGVEPGAYMVYDGTLVTVKKGQFRRVSGYLCLEQRLGEDAAAVFFPMAPLMNLLSRMGNRGYRVAQLEGGIRAGLMYLASYGLGVGATGLTFYDDDVKQFFTPFSDDLENMIVLAVGKPAYRARSGKIILDADKCL
ncbi:MAG: SagB/ThcOx family dehydrogenase [Candidatus Caldarchaeum sp.]